METRSAFVPVVNLFPRSPQRNTRARCSHTPQAKLATTTPPATPSAPVQGAIPSRPTYIVPTITPTDDADLPLRYDADNIAAYWNSQPGAQATRRFLEVTGKTLPFISKVLLEWKTGKLGDTSGLRAGELREILTSLGPTFIKLGQALSVRPDLVGATAMDELQKLCDAVPSFPSEIAFAMIEEELGRDIDDIFSEITPEPIAAASLGQVYRARLRSTGEEVAVKVQRPDMLQTVSLDLFVMRKVALIAQKVQDSFTANRSDFSGLLDQWANGMYKELDYVNEGNNGVRFAGLISHLEGVRVPAVYFDYTARKVLTMEWVHGKRLADSTPEDINRLVGLGVNTFLVQLLDTGFFHADPHVGNLLKNDDGDLVILDFGLMSEMEKSQMDAMISSIIHLANRDYPRVVDDFIMLEFLPDDVDKNKVIPVLGAILDQALEGGGATNVNFQSLAGELSQVTFEFPFKIPPYFALIIRALGVLEGIALSGNPDFKLIMEAYPYVAKRVMSDPSPALQEALQQILYKNGEFSPTRLKVLLDSAKGFTGDGEAFVDFDTPSADGASADEAVDFLFSSDGKFIRELLAEEIANGIDVLARNSSTKFFDVLARNSPFPIMSLPLVPELMSLNALTQQDEAYLKSMRGIVAVLGESGTGQSGNASTLIRLLPTILTKSQGMGLQIAGRLSERFIQRIFDEVLRSGEEIGGRRRANVPVPVPVSFSLFGKRS